jgi:hypothetical protein
MVGAARGCLIAGVLAVMLCTALAPGASAAYITSPWAADWTAQAEDLGLARRPTSGDLREPIRRGDFGEDAAALVARVYGVDFTAWSKAADFRSQQEGEGRPAAAVLGILQGRDNGDLDLSGTLTRQEAAVMLARTYRLCAQQDGSGADALPYADSASIAPWAREDVALLTDLGIFSGVGEGRFAPAERYSGQQALTTLVRLWAALADETPSGSDLFALTPLEEAASQFWAIGYDLLSVVTRDGITAIAWSDGSASMAGAKYFVSVFDQNWSRQDYRTPIAASSDGRYGKKDAPIQGLSLSADGTTVTYQSVVPDDVYDFGLDGQAGDLLFAQGSYIVTIDLFSGTQSYQCVE